MLPLYVSVVVWVLPYASKHIKIFHSFDKNLFVYMLSASLSSHLYLNYPICHISFSIFCLLFLLPKIEYICVDVDKINQQTFCSLIHRKININQLYRQNSLIFSLHVYLICLIFFHRQTFKQRKERRRKKREQQLDYRSKKIIIIIDDR